MKPEAFQHRKVGRLSIWARWLWVGMLHHADDDGRLIADPGNLRLLLFGYDDDVTPTKVTTWLDEVAVSGLVVLYEVDGERYAYFPDWKDHQRIDRPKRSLLPEPPSSPIAPSQRPAQRPHRRTGRPLSDGHHVSKGSANRAKPCLLRRCRPRRIGDTSTTGSA